MHGPGRRADSPSGASRTSTFRTECCGVWSAMKSVLGVKGGWEEGRTGEKVRRTGSGVRRTSQLGHESAAQLTRGCWKIRYSFSRSRSLGLKLPTEQKKTESRKPMGNMVAAGAWRPEAEPPGGGVPVGEGDIEDGGAVHGPEAVGEGAMAAAGVERQPPHVGLRGSRAGVLGGN